jgi:hypothetical protein
MKPQGLRAWATIPWGQGALEVVRTYPLFLPSPLPPLLLALGAFLWAWARAEAAAKRLLGLPLKEAGRRLAALEAAFSYEVLLLPSSKQGELKPRPFR